MVAAAKSTENAPQPSIGFHALTLATFFGASAAPTPLYRIYQENFSLSPVLITVVFAVYAFALLAALLTAGSLSDHLGRKPVIFFALVLEIIAMALASLLPSTLRYDNMLSLWMRYKIDNMLSNKIGRSERWRGMPFPLSRSPPFASPAI